MPSLKFLEFRKRALVFNEPDWTLKTYILGNILRWNPKFSEITDKGLLYIVIICKLFELIPLVLDLSNLHFGPCYLN